MGVVHALEGALTLQQGVLTLQHGNNNRGLHVHVGVGHGLEGVLTLQQGNNSRGQHVHV